MEHKLHLYYGNGKGKTTAGMGLAVRFLGHGKKVLIAQFMKDGTSGELAALKHFPNVKVFDIEPFKGFFAQMTPNEQKKAIASQTQEAQRLQEAICHLHPDMILLDELAIACVVGIVPQNVAESLVAAAVQYGETVVTGYDAPDWLKEQANYVTHLTAEKHPFETEGLSARKCVEW